MPHGFLIQHNNTGVRIYSNELTQADSACFLAHVVIQPHHTHLMVGLNNGQSLLHYT